MPVDNVGKGRKVSQKNVFTQVRKKRTRWVIRQTSTDKRRVYHLKQDKRKKKMENDSKPSARGDKG